MGRRPPGATASTMLSSSLEFIPRSFKPKGGGGTTVKIVLKEKHKKGKGRGQVVSVSPKLPSSGLWAPEKLFQQHLSNSGSPTFSPHSYLSPGGPDPRITTPFLYESPTPGLEEGQTLGCFGDLGPGKGGAQLRDLTWSFYGLSAAKGWGGFPPAPTFSMMGPSWCH